MSEKPLLHNPSHVVLSTISEQLVKAMVEAEVFDDITPSAMWSMGFSLALEFAVAHPETAERVNKDIQAWEKAVSESRKENPDVLGNLDLINSIDEAFRDGWNTIKTE